MKDVLIKNGVFSHSSPEAQGIPSAAILDFLDEVDRNEIDLHSLYIFKNGQLLAGGCRAPFQPDSLHRIYSAAKAVTGLAVLFAVQEGLLTLETPVVSLFPAELAGLELTERMRAMTVRHLLTMTTGHDQDTFRPILNAEGSSIRAFFSVPLDFEPGTHFLYNNGVPHILGLIVKKVSGLDYLSYLKPRFLDPAGIYCTVERTEKGELEGSRTVCTPEGFAKLTLFYLQEGSWNGSRLLDPQLMREAVSLQVPTAQCSSISFPHIDEMAGYGFQVWRNSVGGYRLDGGRSQFGFVFPEYQFALVCNGIEADSGLLPQIFWRTLYPLIGGFHPLAEDQTVTTDQEELARRMAAGSCAPACLASPPTFYDTWYDRDYQLEDNPYHLERLSVSAGKGLPQIRLTAAGRTYAFCVGLDGQWQENAEFPPLPRENARLNEVFGVKQNVWFISGGWLSDFCFIFQVREKGWMDYTTFYCRFSLDRVSLVVESNMEKLSHLRRRIPMKPWPWPDTPINGRQK